MAHAATNAERLADLLAARRVLYDELEPCTTAFIDTRTPGSAEKENFTIIGPGVAESPDQHVHIDIPHGFNIGGARQPPGCVNSQHSHETAEVFIVHSGSWAFMLGPDAGDGRVVLEPGDTISIPTHVFRGFENVGKDTGFLFAVLGGDDPGHVTWAPYVFEKARKHGLVLLDDGSLVDTTRGETVPEGKRPMAPTTAEDVARFDRLRAEDLANCVVRRGELAGLAATTLAGLVETPIIGAASMAEGLVAGRMSWPHGFHVRYLSMPNGAASAEYLRHEEEVILMHRGRLTVELPDGPAELGAGDVLTVPVDMPRRLVNTANELAEAYIVRGGDHPAAPVITAGG